MDTKKTTRSQRIIKAREDKGWDQPTLAGKVGVTKGAVNKWESHGSGSPNIDLNVFFKLADELGVDPRELATGEKKRTDSAAPLSPENQLLMRQIPKVPEEILFPIRSIISAVFLAGSEKYATWSREKGEEARRRDAQSREKA